MSFPAASASASPSHALWSIGLPLFWQTSPLAISIQRPETKSWRCSIDCTARATRLFSSPTNMTSPNTLTGSSILRTEWSSATNGRASDHLRAILVSLSSLACHPERSEDLGVCLLLKADDADKNRDPSLRSG